VLGRPPSSLPADFALESLAIVETICLDRRHLIFLGRQELGLQSSSFWGHRDEGSKTVLHEDRPQTGSIVLHMNRQTWAWAQRASGHSVFLPQQKKKKNKKKPTKCQILS
jgi:hypothetical protein